MGAAPGVSLSLFVFQSKVNSKAAWRSIKGPSLGSRMTFLDRTMSFWAVSRGLTPPSKVVPMLNPNQRQFLEDEVRYREKLKLMARGDAMEEVYVRKQETVDDPLELDKHDSFYQTTKSLLVLFQIMGVMPIHRNPPEKNLPRTGYSWGSKQVMWAIFIYSCQTTIVVLVLRERVKNSSPARTSASMRPSTMSFSSVCSSPTFCSRWPAGGTVLRWLSSRTCGPTTSISSSKLPARRSSFRISTHSPGRCASSPGS